MAIGKFHGVGKVTAQKMNKLGIYSGQDLKNRNLSFLIANFGKSGRYYYDIVRGVQYSEVKAHRIRKSIAAERTFLEDLFEESQMLEKLDDICEELKHRMDKAQVKGKTITLKLKFQDFTLETRSKTIEKFTNNKFEIFSIVDELLTQTEIRLPVRLLGISITKLDNYSAGLGKGKQLIIPYKKY